MRQRPQRLTQQPLPQPPHLLLLQRQFPHCKTLQEGERPHSGPALCMLLCASVRKAAQIDVGIAPVCSLLKCHTYVQSLGNHTLEGACSEGENVPMDFEMSTAAAAAAAPAYTAAFPVGQTKNRLVRSI